jgi:ribosome biogenesis GTPase
VTATRDVNRKRNKKIRVAFSKNRQKRARPEDLTRAALRDLEAVEDLSANERVSGKGDLTRRRTIIAAAPGGAAPLPQREVDESACLRGRILYAVGGNQCRVRAEDRREFECVVRRVVRTLARETRNAVVAGDEVLFLPTGPASGVIERVEPRRGVLSRGSDRREHVIAANVDQALIVVSAADPPLKPGVVDRFLVSAERGGVGAIVCINKIDLFDQVALQPIAGIYAQLGYDVLLASARTGAGIARLRALLRDRLTVVAGQSGVGKSSLLNAVQPGLGRPVGEVSGESRKGRHTTRVAELLTLSVGGWIIDTPGVRQMELWDVIPAEVEGYFREFRPFVAACRFPDCTHVHEAGCAVHGAVEEGCIARRRYESYLRIVNGDD